MHASGKTISMDQGDSQVDGEKYSYRTLLTVKSVYEACSGWNGCRIAKQIELYSYLEPWGGVLCTKRWNKGTLAWLCCVNVCRSMLESPSQTNCFYSSSNNMQVIHLYTESYTCSRTF